MTEKKPAKEDTVTVRNNVRRPISFTCGGKTYRLSPGEQVEVPAAFAQSVELSRLHAAGHVSKTEATDKEKATSMPATGAERRDADEGDTETDEKPARKSDRRKGA